MIHQRIATTVALTLAIAASIAPAAVASSTAGRVVQPNPDEQTAFNAPTITGASCGDVCSGHGYGPVGITTPATVASSTAGPVVRPNPDEQTAFNAPSITGASCGDVCSGHGYGAVNVSTRSIPSAQPSAPAPSSGFDWGDAGIGAGSVLALTMIGVGGVLVASNRRGRHTHQRQPSAVS